MNHHQQQSTHAHIAPWKNKKQKEYTSLFVSFDSYITYINAATKHIAVVLLYLSGDSYNNGDNQGDVVM
jgi:hypothetical protein